MRTKQELLSEIRHAITTKAITTKGDTEVSFVILCVFAEAFIDIRDTFVRHLEGDKAKKEQEAAAIANMRAKIHL